jgi:hypothetical protein
VLGGTPPSFPSTAFPALTAFPAFSVTFDNVTEEVLTANAAMLDVPLPSVSLPEAFTASNSMFSIVIAAVTPVMVSATPLAGATMTCSVAVL